MKKWILALVVMASLTLSAQAMSYEQARAQALFLTDKMAYELNLTEEQYEAAYEVNLDYLMGVNSYDDVYGAYWQQRNIDLSYILLDWQYHSFCNAAYFYRPLYWNDGFWHFRIYARYPRRDYFYFGRPNFYGVYRGGHSWYVNGGQSWYRGRSFGPMPGMQDRFNRGDFGRGHSFGNRPIPDNYRSFGNRNMTQGVPSFGHRNNISVSDPSVGTAPSPSQQSNRSFGTRQSSTRTTVGSGSTFGMRSNLLPPSNIFTPRSSTSRSFVAPNRSNAGSFGGGSTFGGGSGSSFGSRGGTSPSLGGGSTSTNSHFGHR